MRAQFAEAARIAAGQHGRVSRRQLVDAGIDRGRIQRWLADGRLSAVHRGVYAVGHAAPSPRADLMAAVLACGEGALASHASAAHLFGIIRDPPPEPEVTIPTDAGRHHPGIVIHRDPNLTASMSEATWDGIPVTRLPRVLLDLAPRETPAALTRLCHEAWVHRGTTPRSIEECIARNPRKHGAGKLRRAMGSDVTLSHLEDEFLALLERHKLPKPRTNIDFARDKVDCRWPERDLTIELVSFRYHATRHAFEADVARRRRSNHIQYTYGDVIERGARTAAELKSLLGGQPAG